MSDFFALKQLDALCAQNAGRVSAIWIDDHVFREVWRLLRREFDATARFTQYPSYIRTDRFHLYGILVMPRSVRQMTRQPRL